MSAVSQSTSSSTPPNHSARLVAVKKEKKREGTSNNEREDDASDVVKREIGKGRRGRKRSTASRSSNSLQQSGGPQDHRGQTARRNQLINAAIVRTGAPDEDETAVAVSRYPPTTVDSWKSRVYNQLSSALRLRISRCSLIIPYNVGLINRGLILWPLLPQTPLHQPTLSSRTLLFIVLWPTARFNSTSLHSNNPVSRQKSCRAVPYIEATHRYYLCLLSTPTRKTCFAEKPPKERWLQRMMQPQ